MKSEIKNVTVNEKRKSEFLEKGEKYSKKIATIASKHDYSKPESSLGVADDSEYQKEITEQASHLRGVEKVILVGIGGSSLGVEALYTALAFKTNAKLLILDSIEDGTIDTIETFLGPDCPEESFAIVVVSKSGTTTETMTNGVQLLDFYKEKYGKGVHERVIFIGTEDTEFIKIGKKKKVTCITFQETIGGRYSIFTAVGMVPLYLLGIDTGSLRKGATDALDKDSRKLMVDYAATLACLAESGTHTVNFFTFNKRLRLLGFWYRQLLAESIGKNMTTEGATFSHQLLPTVASSVDLHSMAQLYLGGYKGLYTHFLYVDTDSDHHKLTEHWLIEHIPMLRDKTPTTIKNAIREGIMRSYDDQKLPYRFTELPRIAPEELGYLMASLMFEVMVLAHLFDVDAFNQPNVESYKEHTRKLLEV